MKHLLTSVAVVAVLAFAAPVWAQPANPSGGNSMGTPGPNPGGPGLTPYSGGRPPGPKTSGSNYIPPSAPPAAMAPSATSDTSSATPPSHRHAHHHMAHGKMASHHPSRFPNLQGNVANQLNQAELGRLQSGNMSMPSAPPGPGMAPPEQGGPHMSTHGTVQ
jgi:hypothetical protein